MIFYTKEKAFIFSQYICNIFLEVLILLVFFEGLTVSKARSTLTTFLPQPSACCDQRYVPDACLIPYLKSKGLYTVLPSELDCRVLV